MKIKFIAFLLLAFLTSCAGGGDFAPASNTANAAKNVSAPSSKGEVSQSANKNISLNDADKSKAETVPVERKIIRNADLQLEADLPEEAQQKITAIAETKGGFVVESTQSSSNSKATTRDTVTMTIRVPSAKFNESLDEIRKTSNRIVTETVKGQDVTEEFVDIEARLKAKKALEAQFLEIMKQGKTVEDALSVQRQLADVRGEIEQIEGKLRFLENQTSLSTINIRLQTPATYSPNSSGFFYQLKEAFSSGFDFALSFILGLVTLIVALLPFFIFIILPIYLIGRYFWKRKAKTDSAKEIVKEEIKSE
jgi:hypothetical protein